MNIFIKALAYAVYVRNEVLYCFAWLTINIIVCRSQLIMLLAEIVFFANNSGILEAIRAKFCTVIGAQMRCFHLNFGYPQAKAAKIMQEKNKSFFQGDNTSKMPFRSG